MNKVCFIIPTSNAGGIETYLLRFLNLHSASIHAHVLVLSTKRGALAEEYDKLKNVTVLYHPIGYYQVHNFLWFYRFLLKNQFNALCDFNGNFAGLPLAIGKIAGVQKRIAMYRRSSDAFKPGLLNNMYNTIVHGLVYRNATHIISNSKAALNYFFGKQWQQDTRFSVLANGIPKVVQWLTDSQKLAKLKGLGLEQGYKIIGHVGRIDPAKNHDAILKVTQILAHQYKDLRFRMVLCGLDTDSEAFRQRINALGIADHVVPLGQRKDVQELMQCFDVFFFPSLTEGQPNALLEAMAVGLPLVASTIDPIRELLPAEWHSTLVDPHDHAGAAQRIYQLATENESKKQIALQEWCSGQFDLTKNMQRLLSFLTN